MKKITLFIAAAAIIFTSSAALAETGGSVIMQDTFYGVITGAVIGAATLVFHDEPSDHLENIAYGAGVGAILGMVYGVYETTAVASLDNGEIKLAMPSIQTRLVGKKDNKAIQTSVNLFQATF